MIPRHAAAPVEELIVTHPRSPFLLAVEDELARSAEHARRSRETALYYAPPPTTDQLLEAWAALTHGETQ